MPRSFAVSTWALCAVLVLSGCPQEKIGSIPPPGARADTFAQINVSKIDVLWVVDNANLIKPYQQKAADAFATFFDFLQKNKLDFHIAVVSTDLKADQGAFRGDPTIITPDTPDGAQKFQATITSLGDQGSPFEAGLQNADLALRRNAKDFLRADASLFIVFLVDDDDLWSVGDTKYYYRSFKYAKGAGNDGLVLASAIVGDKDVGCTVGDFRADPGGKYIDIANMTGGLFGSICQADYADLFKKLGAAAIGLHRNFPLSKTPQPPLDANSFSVVIHYPCNTDPAIAGNCPGGIEQNNCAAGADITCTEKQSADTWTYQPDTNSITFTAAATPGKGATVEVTYQEQSGR